jgi:hypothetical protein
MLSEAIDVAGALVPALASEMTVSRAELSATVAEGGPAVTSVVAEQLSLVRAS